jgi:hypothetical protein
MRRLVISASWILAGAAGGSLLFWAFLNTPESTIATLAASLLLVVAMYTVAAVSISGALWTWTGDARAARRPPIATGLLALLPPLALALAGWWVVGRGQGWLAAHAGEISAWFIATLDWSDVRPLVEGVRAAGEALRVLVVPFLGLVWLARVLARGWRPLFDRSVAAHALSPWRLAMVAAVAAATLWAPLYYGVYWRPAGLPPPPPFWIEPAFAVVKFAAIATVGAFGLSVIARLAAPRPAASSGSPSTSSPR